MPPYFTDDLFKQVFKNKPVQRTPVPGAPTSENFLRHRIGPNVQLPQKIDLLKVKVLWSRGREEAEEEERRKEEIRKQKEIQHRRLINLVTFSKA